MKELGGFPRRPAPKAVHAAIDLEQRFLSFEQLDTEISALRLALYHPTSFLRDDLPADVRAAYENKILGGFTQEGRERILIAMMKVNFLKRLESSVDSFRLTLERTIDKIDQLEKRITAFEKHLDDNPDIDYDSLTPDQFEDPDFDDEDFTIGGRRRIHLAHLKLPEWLKAVRNDRTQLQFLLEKTAVCHRQARRQARRAKELHRSQGPPAHHQPRRQSRTGRCSSSPPLPTPPVISTSTSTLGRARNSRSTRRSSAATGATPPRWAAPTTTTSSPTSRPIAKRRADQAPRFPNQREEIDLLIATDCISEGQNLQDCDLLVNYDIHWNPVRIIQRFGRIDRIGSRNDSVQLVNFWPVADLDHYLGVKLRVEARMALVDLAATQTDNLLDPGQLEDLIKEDLLFRDRQLKRLKDEILDLEDLDDSVSLTDFSLDEFRLDLLRYLEANRAELEEAGEGLYAVVPPKSDLFISRPAWRDLLPAPSRHRAEAHPTRHPSPPTPPS